jgi:hypothetical protein
MRASAICSAARTTPMPVPSALLSRWETERQKEARHAEVSEAADAEAAGATDRGGTATIRD